MRAAAWILTFAVAAGIGVFVLVTKKGNAGDEQMLAQLAADIDRGGIGDLGRAQALGRHLVLTNPGDREAAAALAFTNAMLAADYGLDTARETADALSRVGSSDAADTASVVATAARALAMLAAGDRTLAARLATEGAAGESDLPHPLYVLGRARARGGDLPGAARALEAAIIRAPSFSPARVAWAQVELDQGDAKTANATLVPLVAQAPKDLRAALLLDEADVALGAGEGAALDTRCNADRWLPPALAAGCTLSRALRARRAGARLEARKLAEAAAAVVPDEPRALARVALALCHLGAVDRASALVDRARRVMAPTAPVLAWAAAGVSLGRGRAAALPTGARPADPEVRLLIARASLAAGGVGALSSTLDELGPAARAGDADIAELARLRGGDTGPAAPAATGAADDPARAFVDGLRARLDGKMEIAADRLGRALSGHGDACRAAGEYRAMLRALKQRPEATVFDRLRAENAACVNLPR